MIGSPERHAAREPGANPGRSRRCEGSCSSAETTGLRAGKVAEGGAPSQKTFRAAANPEPLAEGGFVFRRLITLGAALALVAALATPALAERVKVRVEGKTTTIFGSTEPTLTTGPNALAVLDAASLVGEFYYHVSPGPFVDQIGRFPGRRLQRLELQDQRSLPAGSGGPGAGEGRGHGALVLGDVQRAGQHPDAAPPAPRQAELLLGGLPERPGDLRRPLRTPCSPWTVVA